MSAWLMEQYAAFANRSMAIILELGPFGQAAVLILFLSLICFLLLSFSNVEGRWSRLRTVGRLLRSLWQEICLMFQTAVAVLTGKPVPERVADALYQELRRIAEEKKIVEPVTVGTGVGGPDEELIAELNGFLSRLDHIPEEEPILQVSNTWYEHFVVEGKATLDESRSNSLTGPDPTGVMCEAVLTSAKATAEFPPTNVEEPLPADVDEAMRSFWERVNQPRQTVPKYEIPLENLYPSLATDEAQASLPPRNGSA